MLTTTITIPQHRIEPVIVDSDRITRRTCRCHVTHIMSNDCRMRCIGPDPEGNAKDKRDEAKGAASSRHRGRAKRVRTARQSAETRESAEDDAISAAEATQDRKGRRKEDAGEETARRGAKEGRKRQDAGARGSFRQTAGD